MLRITICYENFVCATFAGQLAVKHVHVQRLVNSGPFLKQVPELKSRCGLRLVAKVFKPRGPREVK